MRSGSDYVPEKKAVSVGIELANGNSYKGRLWVHASKPLIDALNAGQTFLEFTPYGEEHITYLGKGQITSLKVIEIPKSVHLDETRETLDVNDPYHILALTPGAAWPTVREAYIRLAKIYHPDRFSGADLPNEVTEYLGARARRINAAYAMLEDSHARKGSPACA